MAKSTKKNSRSGLVAVLPSSRLTWIIGLVVAVVAMFGAYLALRPAEAELSPIVETLGYGQFPSTVSPGATIQYGFPLNSPTSASQVCVFLSFSGNDRLESNEQMTVRLSGGATAATVLGDSPLVGRACFLDQRDIKVFLTSRTVQVEAVRGSATISGAKVVLNVP
jgi:hypothetical protein